MKKIITTLGTLFIVSLIYAQAGLDTVYSRYVQLQWEDLKWVIGSTLDLTDSLDYATAIKISVVTKAISNKQASTVITVDSIPGRIHKKWYEKYMSTERAETLGLSNNVRSGLRAYTPILPYLESIDNAGEIRRKKKVSIGGFIL